MKTTILLTALMLMCGQASALVSFHTDAEIREGEIYDYVSVFGTATITITGGTVTNGLVVYGDNTIHVSGGYVEGIGVNNTNSIASFNIYSGSDIGRLDFNAQVTANISGGRIGIISSSSNAIINLTGGNITDYLIAYSEIDIYGYGFDFDSEAGAYNGGQLTGFWLDGTALIIDLKNYGGGDDIIGITYDNINLVPEPTTLALLGLGGILTKRS